MNRRAAFLLAAGISCIAPSLFALDLGNPRIKGPEARALFGNGTGVIVGIVDSGIDPYHPALAGNDSLGNPRLVAQANFVTSEPTNTGMDVYGHGTAVAGVVMSIDSTYKGIAPDACFVNARVLDSGNFFATDSWVINGAGFALQNGAEILNMSLSYGAVGSTGNSYLSLMSDWVSFSLKVPVVVSAGNNGAFSGTSHVTRGPGDSFNAFSTAASQSTAYAKIASFSSWGAASDGRIKPDITAPGESITTANDNWETEGDFNSWSGTSFAAPHVTGMLTLATSYGKTHGLSTDPKVLKATLQTSAEKINDRDNNAWAPLSASVFSGVFTATQPLDDNSGAGQINGEKFAQIYLAGEQGPGTLVGANGWDLNSITGISALDYPLGELVVGSKLAATLNWMRHVNRTDNGNGILDSGDTFLIAESLDNLDLIILRDGIPVAASLSTVENNEHLYITIDQAGQYTLRVDRKDVFGSGTDEEFALAWSGTQVPEPGMAMLMLAAIAVFARRGRKALAA